MICHEYLCYHVSADTLYVVHNESSNALYGAYGADFAALIAPVSISPFDAALRGAVRRAV